MAPIIHANSSRGAEVAKRLLRRTRENYVACRIKRIIREEGTLMLRFDAAAASGDLDSLLACAAALCRHRSQICEMIGWPKRPTLRAPTPRALDGIGGHQPMVDVDVALVGSEPRDG